MFSFGQAASTPAHPNCDIKLKKLLEMIEIEFRGVLSDSHAFNKKKHPEVKSKLEIAAQWITENKGKEPAHIDEHLTLIVDVFFCIIEEKQVKLYLQVFNIIQRLVMTVPGKVGAEAMSNEFKMSQDCRERLLYFFSVVTYQDQSSKNAALLDDNQQIKVLQVIMLFLDPNQADAISKKFVNYVLKTCFQLFDGKKAAVAGAGSQSVAQSSQGTMIKSTIQASLGQLMSMMLALHNAMAIEVFGEELFKTKDFEQKSKVFQIIKDKQDEIQNIPIFQVVEDFLSDLATALFIHEQGELEVSSKKTQPNANQQSSVHTSSIIGGMLGSISNQHVWNFKPSPSTKCALLDLICLVFDQDQHPLIFFPRIGKLFENQIIPTLNNMIRNIEVQPNYDYMVGIRVIKCITIVIDNLCIIPASPDDPANLNDSQMSLQSEGSASSKSKSQKNIVIQGIEHMMNVFSKMADQEQIAQRPGKDKEINSQNIQQVFLKLNWRHLSGLEAMTIFLQNPAVLSNLIRQDKGKSICTALNIINRNLNQTLLLDHRNMQILLSNFSEGISSPLNTHNSTINPKLKNPEQASFFERNKVSKLILDSLGAADDDLLRTFLNPYHFQKLSQECVNGLIISLDKYYYNNGDSKSCEGDSKSTSSASDSKRQQMDRPETDGTELIEISQILNEMLNKLHLSIQCNLGSMQDVKSANEEDEDLDHKFIYSFDSVQSQYLVQQKCLLGSFKRMINMLGQNKMHIELRDNFVNSLCSLCFQKEVEMSKQGVAANLGVGGFTITVGNVMAAQTLIDITNQFLQRTAEFTKKKKRKSLQDEGFMHEQDLTLWQNILEAILRMDSTLTRQIEDQNQKAQKVQPKGNLTNLQSLDVTHLVDFNKIQKKVNNLPEQERKLSSQLSPQGNDDKNLSRMYSTVNVSSIVGRQSLIAEAEEKPKTKRAKAKPLSNVWCFNGPKFQGGKYLSVIEISQNRLQKVNQTIVIPNLQTLPIQSDLTTLQSQLDQIFTNSQYCQKLTLFQLYGSFSRILSELVQNGIQSANIDTDLNKQSMSIQLINRLIQLSFINIDRLDLIWDQLVAMMDTLLQNQKLSNGKQNKSNVFIKLSIEFNQAIVLSYFSYKRSEQARKYLGVDVLANSQLEQLGGDQVSPYPMELMSPNPDGLVEQPGKASQISVSDTESDNKKSPGQELSANKLEESPLFNDVGDQVLWARSNWQSTILQPITTIIQSIDLSNVNEKYLALRSIEKIIQLCGQNMKKEGWTVIIENLGKANEIFNTASVKSKQVQSPEIIKLELQIVFNCFKCLKLIINNYIQQLSQDNFIQIINCLKSFAEQDNDNINSNLTAIGMFMNIADYVAKLTRDQNEEQQITQQEMQIDVNFIWQELFTTMQDIGKQHISEIRRSLIQTLENIIMNHGSILSQQVWTLIFQSTLTDIIKHSSDMFIHIGNSKYSDIQQLMNDTPSHSQRKKMAFDDENVLKALKANDDQSWSETCIQLISSIYRTIQKYIQIGGNTDQDMLTFWISYHEILCSLVFHTTHREPQLDKTVATIIIQIFKSIEDFLKPECQAFMTQNICQVFEVVKTTNLWILDETNHFAEFIESTSINVCRNNSMILKITPDILQTLSKLYSIEVMESSVDKDAEYWSIDKVSSILSVVKSLTLGCQQIGRGYIQPGKPYKLLNEEKGLFKYIDKFNVFCQRSSAETQLMYLEFLLSYISVRDGDVLQESTVKKNISIFNSILLTGKVKPEVLEKVIERLFNKVKSCMQQRYNWKACKNVIQLQLSTIQEPEGGQAQNLFLYLSNQIIALSKFLLNPITFKSQGLYKQHLSLNEEVVGNPDLIQTIHLFNNSAVQQTVWKLILPLLKEDLLFKIANFEDLESDLETMQDKQLFHELIQQSQMLDMEVINFVVSTLLPCCTQVSQGDSNNVEEELINIVDNGCQNSLMESSSHAVLKDLVSGKTSSNLSQYCLLNLFQICRFGNQAKEDSGADEHMHQIKQRISQQTTPILLNRCKDILRKYAQDESRSGSIQLPQSRVHEIVLILKELMTLAHSFEGDNYFLLDLMPILTELISSNNREIKEQLKQIFIEISNEVQKLKKH